MVKIGYALDMLINISWSMSLGFIPLKLMTLSLNRGIIVISKYILRKKSGKVISNSTYWSGKIVCFFQKKVRKSQEFYFSKRSMSPARLFIFVNF